MKRRRKAVTCVLCETEETYMPSAVCRDCVQTWTIGRDAQKEAEAQEVAGDTRTTVKVARYMTPYKSQAWASDVARISPFHDEKLEKEFRQMLLQATGAVRAKRFLENTPAIIVGGWYREDGKLGDRPPMMNPYYTTPDQAEAVQRIYQILCAYCESFYQQGVRDGERFLVKMADGQVTVNDLEDRLVKNG